MNLAEKEEIEINYWRDTTFENAQRFTASNFLNKSAEARNLHYKIAKYKDIIKPKTNVLEIGAGQGWASCFMKRFVIPQAKFTVTDISKHAIDSLSYWENTFDVKIDKSAAIKSYDVAEIQDKFDLIFCYAAFHHFVKYEETLSALKNILSPNGHILFLYEPTSSKLFYNFYYKYVNWMPHSTPEDVIVPSKIKAICERVGLNYTNHYDSNQIIFRSFFTSFYFKMLKVFPFLSRLLPSSSDLLFWKKI